MTSAGPTRKHIDALILTAGKRKRGLRMLRTPGAHGIAPGPASGKQHRQHEAYVCLLSALQKLKRVFARDWE